MNKSPFIVIQDFISPLACENIVRSIPSSTANGNPTGDFGTNNGFSFAEISATGIVQEEIKTIIPSLVEEHYSVKIKNVEKAFVEWYPTGAEGKIKCDNSTYIAGGAKKWVQHEKRDFSGILFLMDYNEKVPFDGEFEVYGGKLEFPQHGFGFNPQRGTLIIYPSGPYFINHITPVNFGELFLVRFFIETEPFYVYQAANFPGNYIQWFKEYA